MEYRIIRSRRKTLSLQVTREGEAVVRAPLRLSAEYIENFVNKHEAWIARRKSEMAARPRLDLSDGAKLTLFGSDYTIRTGRARIGGGEIVLPAEKREEALSRLLRKFSLEVMTVLTNRLARTFGFRYSSVRIGSARGRWGSCNRDCVIAYTFRVAFLPPRLTEYVVIHELSHTVVFDHSPAFWETVGRVLPDWKIRRKELKSCRMMDFL